MPELPRTPRSPRHPRATAYVVGGAVGTTVLLALGDRLPAWVIPVWSLYLGPLGLLLLVAAGLLVLFGLANPLAQLLQGVGGDVLVVLVVTSAALLNAALVIRAARVGAPAGAHEPYVVTDRLLASTLFLFAGTAFVVLCVVDGAVLLLARGVDTVEPDSIAVPQQTAASVSLAMALVIAVAGLVVWPVLWRSGRRMLWWAVGDLAAQVALIAIPVLVSEVVSSHA